MPTIDRARDPGTERARRPRLTYIPIRHGPLPDKPETAEHADLRHVLGTVAGVATGVTVWLVTDSVVLAVFWALVASYVVLTIAPTRPREPLIRRVAVAVLAAGTAAGVLALTLAAWDATWLACAVALAAGAVVAGIGEATR